MQDSTISALRKLKHGNSSHPYRRVSLIACLDPIYTSPYVPNVAASALPIAFGDFPNYWICDRLGRTVQRLNELYSANRQVGFTCTQRVDGKIILAEDIQLLKMGS